MTFERFKCNIIGDGGELFPEIVLPELPSPNKKPRQIYCQGFLL